MQGFARDFGNDRHVAAPVAMCSACEEGVEGLGTGAGPEARGTYHVGHGVWHNQDAGVGGAEGVVLVQCAEAPHLLRVQAHVSDALPPKLGLHVVQLPAAIG